MYKNIWTDPREFRLWNEEMSKQYDPDFFHNHPNPLIRWIETERVRWICKLLNYEKGQRILDVGCGAGNVLIKITNAELYGIDISKYLLNKANTLVEEKAHLGLADALRLPFRDNIFDRVICSEVIEHVVNPVALMLEIRRVLKPEGLAVFTIPNEHLISRMRKMLNTFGLFNFFFKKNSGNSLQSNLDYFNEWHLYYFDSYTFRPVLLRYYIIQESKSIPTFLFPLHRLFQVKPLKETVRL